MNERIFLIIDGSNFYHRLKELELKNLLNFDYGRFSQFLTGKRELVRKSYYIGAIRTESNNPKSYKLWRNQRILIGRLKKQGFEMGMGHMLKTDVYHEKGVDVLMAVDLLIGAYENTYDTAILITSDTDLLPAIEKVRSMGKKIEYIGSSIKPSLALVANSDIRRLLIKEELEQFIKSV
ncbi:NYN domain-containing protein [Patescibacteria group bacterium]|nr:NYN domain-containing protein [Patescibacteria group bacterium]MBU4162425.1 NYN domain-containing protein [Patescibacteria group bacterium]